MLQDIIDSKYSSELLSFFLVSPNRTFSSFELAKRLRMKKSALSRALHQLIELDLVRVAEGGRTTFYIINKKHKLLPELRRGVQRTQRSYEDELFYAIKKLGTINAAYLSGIFTGHPELPVDLLLVGKVQLNKLSKFLDACKKMMHHDINYSIMTPQEFQLRKDTFDRFIKDIFDYDHVVVVEKSLKTKRI